MSKLISLKKKAAKLEQMYEKTNPNAKLRKAKLMKKAESLQRQIDAEKERIRTLIKLQNAQQEAASKE